MRGLLAAFAAATLGGAALAQTPTAPFTAAQAEQGQDLYAQDCAVCHGQHLDDGEFAPSLKSANFRTKWGALPPAALYAYVSRAMPPGGVGTLSADEYDAILAFIYQANGAAAGSTPLKAEPASP